MQDLQLSTEIREYIKLLIDLLKATAWPIALAALLIYYRSIIANALSRSKELLIKIAGNEFKLTTTEATSALTDIFGEIDVLVRDHLTTDEKLLLLKVGGFTPYQYTVIEAVPTFTHELNSPTLKMLRALRGAYLVRPLEGGKWRPEKHIQLTNFGSLVLKYKREALLESINLQSPVNHN